MMKDKTQLIIEAAKEFRQAYLNDVLTFGEDYWKEKLLLSFGELNQTGATWEKCFDGDFVTVFDNCTSLEVAKVLIENF